MADSPAANEGGGAGGACGCLAALAAAPALGIPFLVAMGLEICLPGNACRRDDEAVLYGGAALVLGLAVLLGLSVRALVRWGLARRRDPAAPLPARAAAGAGAVLLILAWTAWRMWPVLGP